MSKKTLIKRIFSETIDIASETDEPSVNIASGRDEPSVNIASETDEPSVNIASETDEPASKRIKSRFSKPCRYIKKNRPCRFGDKCNFAHHYSEL